MRIRILTSIAAVLVLAQLSAADSFTLTQLNDADKIGSQTLNYGQSFTPSIGGGSASPIGVGATDPVYLNSINFRHGRVEGNATRYLNIYSALVHINPSTSVAVATPIFVGSSTNQVSAAVAPGVDLIWNFDGLALTYGDKYYAAFSTTATPGDIAGGISLAWHGNASNPYAGGAFLHDGGELGIGDVYFVISLNTTNPNPPVPEPGTIALLGLAVLGYGIHRRRRAAS